MEEMASRLERFYRVSVRFGCRVVAGFLSVCKFCRAIVTLLDLERDSQEQLSRANSQIRKNPPDYKRSSTGVVVTREHIPGASTILSPI